jgi:radical SAM superfamily enzyme YgiQ (UPF0313 family)
MKTLFLMRDDGFMTEPMNIMELSSLAKHDRPDRSTHLGLIERDNVVELAKELKPQVVAASAITGSHTQYIEALHAIKQALPDTFVILGGPYCSTFPDAIVSNPSLDAVGIMECDEAWPMLLDALEGGQDVNDLPNILTKENASSRLVKDIVTGQTIARPDSYHDRFSNLDSLPFLDRSLVYDNTAFYHRPKRTHMAGRGCPFRCQYCFEQDWNAAFTGKGKLLQRYSVDRFLDELETVGEQYDTRFWKFYDDVFPTFPNDMEWLTEFASKYSQRIGLPFHCLTRCDLVMKNPQVLDLLKEAGAASITMSIESGNSFIRDHIITRDMEDWEIREAFALCAKKGIKTFANTILGIPGPRLPDVHDPEFDEKVAEIEDDTKYFNSSSRGRKARLEELWEGIKSVQSGVTSGEFSLEHGRTTIQNMLSEIGVKASQLEYDRESVQYNVDLNVSLGEFPIMYPYPRTGTGAYATRKGWFDGDYDKLHHSYQNRSPFSCFTDHEKAVQQNLALLGPVATLVSGSHRRWVRIFSKPVAWVLFEVMGRITWPWVTKLYQHGYSITKTYIYHERIYPMQRTWKERLKDFAEASHLDVFKQFRKSKMTDKRLAGPELRDKRPGQTLGGPPSV